jgi:hypothetical protein
VGRVSHACGLRVERPIPVELVDRSQLPALLAEATGAAAPSEAVLRRDEVMAGLGLAERDGQQMPPWLGAAAGLYVPERRKLFLVRQRAVSPDGTIHLESSADLAGDVTLAHEVTHSLQHMHHPELFEGDEEAIWSQQADAAAALQAAIEGHASYCAAKSLGFLGGPRDPEEVIESAERDAEAGFGPFARVPVRVRKRLEFPYVFGYRLAYREERDVLASPPASTEQVLHPERRGRRPFLAVDLVPFADWLASRGCRVLAHDSMGELGLSLWLGDLASPTDPADPRAWEGWNGDRWLLADCGRGAELAWLTSWDAERDAEEFEAALVAAVPRLQQRAGLSSPWAAERRDTEVLVATEGLRADLPRLAALARRARVTTRSELAAHYQRTPR